MGELACKQQRNSNFIWSINSFNDISCLEFKRRYKLPANCFTMKFPLYTHLSNFHLYTIYCGCVDTRHIKNSMKVKYVLNKIYIKQYKRQSAWRAVCLVFCGGFLYKTVSSDFVFSTGCRRL